MILTIKGQDVELITDETLNNKLKVIHQQEIAEIEQDMKMQAARIGELNKQIRELQDQLKAAKKPGRPRKAK